MSKRIPYIDIINVVSCFSVVAYYIPCRKELRCISYSELRNINYVPLYCQ